MHVASLPHDSLSTLQLLYRLNVVLDTQGSRLLSLLLEASQMEHNTTRRTRAMMVLDDDLRIFHSYAQKRAGKERSRAGFHDVENGT